MVYYRYFCNYTYVKIKAMYKIRQSHEVVLVSVSGVGFRLRFLTLLLFICVKSLQVKICYRLSNFPL